jgi:dienelactone hydrolase
MTVSPWSHRQEPDGRFVAVERVDEEVVRLGSDDHLVGILSLPPHPTRLSPPAVIILNAGVLHRVGPHRLHVNLARQLAAIGFPSLRLDLSGIGDSRSVPSGLTFRDSSVADVQAVMDRLEQQIGARHFIIFGVCSGADNGLAAAVADRRVSGLVLVDPPSYATTRSRLRQEMARALALKSSLEVLTWARRRLGFAGVRLGALGRRGLRAAFRRSDDAVRDDGQGRVTPPIEVFRATLTGLIDRGVGVLAVFSGGLYERYNDEDQVFELFPELRGRLDRAYFPGANHTFTERASQDRLLRTVVGWVDQRA